MTLFVEWVEMIAYKQETAMTLFKQIRAMTLFMEEQEMIQYELVLAMT